MRNIFLQFEKDKLLKGWTSRQELMVKMIVGIILVAGEGFLLTNYAVKLISEIEQIELASVASTLTALTTGETGVIYTNQASLSYTDSQGQSRTVESNVIKLQLSAPELVSGTIYEKLSDTQAQPSSGATVAILSLDRTQTFGSTQTSGSGQFSLRANLPADGTYIIQTSKTGYRSYSGMSSFRKSQTTSLRFSVVLTLNSLSSASFRITAPALTGTVKDNNNQPIAGASLKIQQTTTQGVVTVKQQTATETGEFFFVDQITVGSYTLLGEKIDYRSAKLAVNLPSSQPVNLALQKSIYIGGKVIDQNGMAVSGANISILETGETVMTQSVSRVAGMFKMWSSKVERGKTYTLEVSKIGYRTERKTITVVAQPGKTTVVYISLMSE